MIAFKGKIPSFDGRWRHGLDNYYRLVQGQLATTNTNTTGRLVQMNRMTEIYGSRNKSIYISHPTASRTEHILRRSFSQISSTNVGIKPTRRCNVRRRNAKLPTTTISSTPRNRSLYYHRTASPGTNRSASTTDSSSDITSLGGIPLPYGLRRVDYSKGPGRQWPLPAEPPDTRNIFMKALPYVIVAGFVYACVVVYFNWDESVLDYWRSIEMGEIPAEGLPKGMPPPPGSTLEEEDDDDLLDDDEDEWADHEDVSQNNKGSGNGNPSTKDTTSFQKK